MNIIRLSAVVLIAAQLFAACHRKSSSDKTALTQPAEPSSWVTEKPLTGEPVDSSMLEYTLMDPVDIMPENTINRDSLLPYNASHTFEHDLLHTKIEIAFDWAKKRANGKATLKLRPWFYATNSLTLDAKNFDIHSVKLANSGAALKYTYDNEQLVVQLDKTYTRTQEFSIVVEYTAKPDERESYGGSAAITSDKGLYFINPDGSESDKPRQIWTQGETESNSFWFPTIDKPNERCTQEMYITVEDKYKTLSNGIFVSSAKNANGTRTDYWKMDQPHAPYLFMMAIGEFAVVKDKWRGKDVSYFVEPKYEQDARDIFPYTTEMLEFFSTTLGYEYPWPKFDQVIVRDYVSGAMENTTAVIFGEYMQKTKRELLDDHLTNEKVVAHEMFHHWFGDLVTTENWANLTLNEGFANYSEYLWMEHKHGKDAADNHRHIEQQGYLFSAGDGGHPLIHFGYDKREDMFDAHSYNKGGCVLHMLRNYVGDEAFFAALRTYLERNKFTEVEVHELRLAFEDVTGQDLNWFFNQWYLGSGHPSLDITYDYDAASAMASVTIEQQQAAENGGTAVYRLPMAVDIYNADGSKRREQIEVTKRKQTFLFKATSKPALINVDADKMLLCVKNDQHTAEEWAFMYDHGTNFFDRLEALNGLSAEPETAQTYYIKALNDKCDAIRDLALGAIQPGNELALPAIAQIADKEPVPGVRASAIAILGQTQDKQYVPIIQKGLGTNEAYSVVGAALSALSTLDPAAAISASKALENENSDAIIAALAELYAQMPGVDQLAWFKSHEGKVDQMAAFTFFENYQLFLVGLKNEALLNEGILSWKKNALSPDTNSEWRRFASTKALADTRNYLSEKGNQTKALELESMITEIKEKETDPTLKMYYSLF